MALLITDNDMLRAYLPNTVFEVEGETPLFDKVLPHIERAEAWFGDTFLEHEAVRADGSSLSGVAATADLLADIAHGNGPATLLGMCREVVAYQALMDAVPTLDLVLTPNGFGVVSNSNVAPASKERVERLLAALEKCRDDAIDRLLCAVVSGRLSLHIEPETARVALVDVMQDTDSLVAEVRLKYHSKGMEDTFIFDCGDPTLSRDTMPMAVARQLVAELALQGTAAYVCDIHGQRVAAEPRQWFRTGWFTATLFPSLCSLASADGMSAALGSHRWCRYLELRPQILDIEASLSEEYFSPELMAQLRFFAASRLDADTMLLVKQGGGRWNNLLAAVRSQVLAVLRDGGINHRRCVDIVNLVRSNPDTFPSWAASATARLFQPHGFSNKKKSTGYWF